MFSQCPKCGHAPLPANQALPAACPGCGVILAKLATPAPSRRAPSQPDSPPPALWLHVPAQVDPLRWWLRAALLAGFTVWGWHLIAMDYRDGSLMNSFLHRPLLIFHEAGHVVFMPFGEWMSVAGGTLRAAERRTVCGRVNAMRRLRPRPSGSYSVSRPMRSSTSSAVQGSMSEPQRLSRYMRSSGRCFIMLWPPQVRMARRAMSLAPSMML
jgi:hypothetical protein